MSDKKISFVPFGDQVLVLPEEPEKTTKSGIILATSSDEKIKRGKVVVLGDVSNYKTSDGKQYQFTVKEGTTVYWRYGGSELEIDGVKYIVLRESDILGFEK